MALHAGSAPALALAAACGGPRARARRCWRSPCSAAPLAGLALERPIERRLGGPRTVALAQIAAGAALWLADRRGGRARRARTRATTWRSGVAQALALVPGVSRAGAALTAAPAARARPAGAAALALQAALPVTAGAAALEGAPRWPATATRRRRAPGHGGRRRRVAGRGDGRARALFRRVAGSGSYAPLAAYRIAFGVAALAASPARR